MRLTKSESVSLIVYVSLFHFGPSVSQKKSTFSKERMKTSLYIDQSCYRFEKSSTNSR